MTTQRDGNDPADAPRWTEQERKRFAAMLGPARKAAGLSQEDVEEMSGVSRRTLGSAERGDKIPQSAILKRLMIAVDLYDDAANDLSLSTRRWLAQMGPWVEKIPEGPRDIVMGGVLATLAHEAGRHAERHLAAVDDMSQADVTLAASDEDIDAQVEAQQEEP